MHKYTFSIHKSKQERQRIDEITYFLLRILRNVKDVKIPG